MATKAFFLVALCLCILLPFSTSDHGPFRVMGRVYCDTCRAGFETNVTTYIAGARVRVECKDRDSLAVMFREEGVTDSTGTYSILVDHDHGDQMCESAFVSSPVSDCKVPDPGRSRSTIVLTRTQNGIVNDLHYANALGCFKDVPLPECYHLMKYYLADDI
ncbi:protein DOWNSTREAM OF FLC-like [Prosopis cineraria]|uniref:protein DOWNSTREAM OF FLC-like n=1 Tax=Prosopis cineraria TaxID=364024 RepID=UPI00240FE6E9|nr:protein DOWNSTREAM OF FLC-like [Prosopis cineraria]